MKMVSKFYLKDQLNYLRFYSNKRIKKKAFMDNFTSKLISLEIWMLLLQNQ